MKAAQFAAKLGVALSAIAAAMAGTLWLGEHLDPGSRGYQFRPTATPWVVERRDWTGHAITINRETRELWLWDGPRWVDRWKVALGELDHRGETCTPAGMFRVIEKSTRNPNVGDRQFGSRVLKLNVEIGGQHVCIHGTNEPELIGRYVSHACVRMRNEDVEQLYDLVDVGTPVWVH